MAHHFIEKQKGKSYLKLHKKIYSKSLIDKIKEEASDFILSVVPKKNYYFLEINADRQSDYFDFLNYLIYLYKK